MSSFTSTENRQDLLDRLKLRLSCEVLARFPINIIRAKARDNLARWKADDCWGPSYDEWLEIIEYGDDRRLINCMVGLSENSNRLRQSIPYVGLLDQETVRSLREETSC
jgi:hypothetical protein